MTISRFASHIAQKSDNDDYEPEEKKKRANTHTKRNIHHREQKVLKMKKGHREQST